MKVSSTILIKTDEQNIIDELIKSLADSIIVHTQVDKSTYRVDCEISNPLKGREIVIKFSDKYKDLTIAHFYAYSLGNEIGYHLYKFMNYRETMAIADSPEFGDAEEEIWVELQNLIGDDD